VLGTETIQNKRTKEEQQKHNFNVRYSQYFNDPGHSSTAREDAYREVHGHAPPERGGGSGVAMVALMRLPVWEGWMIDRRENTNQKFREYSTKLNAYN
jgi:hypothetical protein